MATNVTLNGTTYAIPAEGDSGWGTVLANYFIALGSGVLQKSGGVFTLSSDVDFGASFGIKLAYLKSQAANPAGNGAIRLGNTETIAWRNFLNTADNVLTSNASDALQYNGSNILIGGLGTIVNADISATAAIAYSKLALAGSVLNADISATAAIVYSKLSLTGSILNADISPSAAIAFSKMAALGLSKALVSDIGGLVTVSAVTAIELGYLSGVTSSVQTQISAKQDASTAVTLTGIQTVTNKTMGLADGTLASPALNFTSDTSTGLYKVGAAEFALVAGGYAGLDIRKSTGTYANVGMGGPASTSDLYPLLISRSNPGGINFQISNPDTTASGSAKIQVNCNAGNTTGEIGVFPNASTLVAYANRMTVRPYGPTNGLSLFGGDNATGDIQLYTGGDYQPTGEAFRVNGDKSIQLMQAIATPATPAAGLKIYAKSDNKVYTKTALGVESVLGSGGAGGINYITNPDIESNATGYNAYANAAAARPTTGTGGVPTVTAARSTVTPLRGTASLLYTKPASNVQGQGFSYDFTIDSADKAKVLRISFDYAIASGTYSGGSPGVDSDLIVDIYDVTNAQIIEPAAIFLDGGVVGTNYKYSGTFQTASNSTSYRLIVHQATVSANPFSVQFDNFAVSPQVVSIGGSVGDLKAYTPTITGLGTGTVGQNQMFYRRVGDSLHGEFRFQKDASAGTGAATVYISLPPGISADGNKMAANATAGIGSAFFNGTVGDVQITVDTGANQIYFYSNGTGLTGSSIAAGAVMTGSFVLPVVGWGSSQVLSSETDTRVVAFTGSVGFTAANNGAATAQITGITSSLDTHGGFASNAYTVKVPGVYELSVTGSTGSTAGSKVVSFNKNGARGMDVPCSIAAYSNFTGTQIVQLAAGDVISLTYNNYNASETWTINSFVIKRLSGPSQIAASESVMAVYSAAGGQTLASGALTQITFATKEDDTHGAFTGSNTFTAPVSGRYHIEGLVGLNTTTGTTGSKQAIIYKNGASVATVSQARAYLSATNDGILVSKKLRLNVGDTISIYGSQNIEASETTTALSYISIARVGN